MIEGAEPMSAGSGRVGVLVLHGFTGNPQSVRPLADALVAQGFSVEMPLLSGHGTTVEDMMTTDWLDWSADAETALSRLAERTETQVVAGLSMGGSLTVWLATRHPELAGIICINPATRAAAEVQDFIRALIEAGDEDMASIGSDVADPSSPESSYDRTPLRPLLSLFEAADVVAKDLPKVTAPLLLFTSPQDHVVPPTDSDFLAESLNVPVEREFCERSYHVATLDYDKQLIIDRSIEFINRVTASPPD
ncbi:MAG: alpha/beta fold hydrolase [Microthrixaceae bacterium]